MKSSTPSPAMGFRPVITFPHLAPLPDVSRSATLALTCPFRNTSASGAGANRSGTFTGIGTDASLVGNFGGLKLSVICSVNFGKSGAVSTFGRDDFILDVFLEPSTNLLGGPRLLDPMRRR